MSRTMKDFLSESTKCGLNENKILVGKTVKYVSKSISTKGKKLKGKIIHVHDDGSVNVSSNVPGKKQSYPVTLKPGEFAVV